MGGEGSAGEIHALAERLRGLADELRDPELPDGRAAELAREAADAVSEAGNAVERAVRDAEDESAASA